MHSEGAMVQADKLQNTKKTRDKEANLGVEPCAVN
jgi:hypothetical protein